jgi:uncharacterized damage-inducible protein DinB
MDHFPMMARFNQWANGRIYDTVERLPEPVLRADQGLFFGSVLATLNHLLVVDRVWTRRIAGKEHGIRRLDTVLHDDLAALRRAREEEDVHIIAFIDALAADGALERDFEYQAITTPDRMRVKARYALAGLFNHQTHHRGQVHAVLTRQGLKIPDLDVIYYLADIGEAVVLK